MKRHSINIFNDFFRHIQRFGRTRESLHSVYIRREENYLEFIHQDGCHKICYGVFCNNDIYEELLYILKEYNKFICNIEPATNLKVSYIGKA